MSQQNKQPFDAILTKALKSGLSGSGAMAIQVCSLMWLRTTMNYQYRHGGTMFGTLKLLYNDGGIRRFYRGLSAALLQAPLSRFGDTFSNTLFLAFLDSYDSTKNLNPWLKTIGASVTAGGFRIVLTPVDTVKTILQVEGAQGLRILGDKFRKRGPTVFFHGALATAAATMVGHYPWFGVYNYLRATLPTYQEKYKMLLRQAFIGFTASVVSDTCSNSIRVIKTTKQTHQSPITYPEAFKLVVEKDGYVGLFGRGLKTRIFTNGLQGLVFSVLWKVFEDLLHTHPGSKQ